MAKFRGNAQCSALLIFEEHWCLQNYKALEVAIPVVVAKDRRVLDKK